MADQQGRLTHVDEHGAARMVDVGDKPVTTRTASATGRVLVSPAVVELLRGEGVPKGDALAVARIGAVRASVLSSLEVVVTLILAAIFLGEALGPRSLAGAVLILSAVVFQNLGTLRRLATRRGGAPAAS